MGKESDHVRDRDRPEGARPTESPGIRAGIPKPLGNQYDLYVAAERILCALIGSDDYAGLNTNELVEKAMELTLALNAEVARRA